MNVGDVVVLKEDTVPYYSGYGGLPHCRIPAGTRGVVSHVNVPPVRGNGPNFNVARFEFEGNSWSASFYRKDVA